MLIGPTERGTDEEAPLRPRAGVQPAPVRLDPLAHSDDSQPRSVRRRRAAGPAPVVGDLDLQLVVEIPNRDQGTRRTGVLDHVGERLLDDPVRGEVERLRKRDPLALHGKLDGQPARPRLLDQPVQVVDPGLRRQRPLVILARSTPSERRMSASAVARRPLDRLQRLAGALGIALEDPARPFCLHDDHPDAVGDDVVELARDAGALVAHGDTSSLLLLALGGDEAKCGAPGRCGRRAKAPRRASWRRRSCRSPPARRRTP